MSFLIFLALFLLMGNMMFAGENNDWEVGPVQFSCEHTLSDTNKLNLLIKTPSTFQSWIRKQPKGTELGPIDIMQFIEGQDLVQLSKTIEVLNYSKISMKFLFSISSHPIATHGPDLFGESTSEKLLMIFGRLKFMSFDDSKSTVSVLLISSNFSKIRQQRQAFDLLNKRIVQSRKVLKLDLLKVMKVLISWTSFWSVDRHLLYSHVKTYLSEVKRRPEKRSLTMNFKNVQNSRLGAYNEYFYRRALSIALNIDWQTYQLDFKKQWESSSERVYADENDLLKQLQETLQQLNDSEIRMISFYYELLIVEESGKFNVPELSPNELPIFSDNIGYFHIYTALSLLKIENPPKLYTKASKFSYKSWVFNPKLIESHLAIHERLLSDFGKLDIFHKANDLVLEWDQIYKYRTEVDAVEFIFKIQRLYERVLLTMIADPIDLSKKSAVSVMAGKLVLLIDDINSSPQSRGVVTTMGEATFRNWKTMKDELRLKLKSLK